MSGRRSAGTGRRSGAGREHFERSAPEVSPLDPLSPVPETRASAPGHVGSERRNPRRSARAPQSGNDELRDRPWTRQSRSTVRDEEADRQNAEREGDSDDDLPRARPWARITRRARAPVKDEDSDDDGKKDGGRYSLRNAAARAGPVETSKDTLSALPTTQRRTSGRRVARSVDHAETYAPPITRRRASERNAATIFENTGTYAPPVTRRRASERNPATSVHDAENPAVPTSQRRTSGRTTMRPINYAEPPSSPPAENKNRISSFSAVRNKDKPKAPLSPLYERPPRTQSQEAYLRSDQSIQDIQAFRRRMQESADTVFERRHGYSRNTPSAGHSHGAGYPRLTGHVGVATPAMRDRGVETFFGMMNTAAREDPDSLPSARGERVIPRYLPPEQAISRRRQRQDDDDELERHKRHERRGRR